MNPRRALHPYSLAVASLLFITAASLPALAQPSGGPYGPRQQRYEVPKTAAHVYYVAPDGQADAAGASLDKPTTLEHAIAQVVTGDAIILRGGTYRTGGLKLNQGITIEPYLDERPVLKGTRVATEWESLRNHIWRTAWPTLFPSKPLEWWHRAREIMRTPLHRFNNDMVFVDGRFLQSAGAAGELDENSYYVDYDYGYVYIGTDPTNHVVEITAFDSALVRTTAAVHAKEPDKKGPVIRGITFTQYAYRALEVEGKRKQGSSTDEPTDYPEGPADPATYGKEVVGTTLEDVTISFCSRVAGYFRGDGLIIRHSLVSDTSTEGIYIIASSDVLLEKNIFRRNNIEKITGYYPSAVKIFNQSYRVTCRDNLVLDNRDSNAIWWDVGNVDGVFVDNWVEDSQDGFFYEISKNAICARNVFVNCEHGVRTLNASNVRVYNNTLVNSPAAFQRNERGTATDHFGWHIKTGPDVDKRDGHVFVGNLLVADARFQEPLLRVAQTKPVCYLTKPQMTRVDSNVYVRPGDSLAKAMFVWSPSDASDCLTDIASFDELRKQQPTIEVHGRHLDLVPEWVFKGPALHNFYLLRSLTGTDKADPLPAEALTLLGWKPLVGRPAGAFPVRP
jgi:hypothetical protein